MQVQKVPVANTTIYYVHGDGVLDRYSATGKMLAHSKEGGLLAAIETKLNDAVDVVTLIWGTH